MKNYKMWIGGKWVDAGSGKTFPAYNPATGEEIARVPLADKPDIDEAIAAARKALPIWSKKTPAERSEILCKMADKIAESAPELAELDIINHGTPVAMAGGGVMMLPETFKYFAQVSRSFMGQVISARPDKFFYLQREPRGVCALFIAWNGPLINTGFKLPAALATGNTCVIKPSSACSLEILKLGEILENLDLPAGLINIVTGPGGTVGETLASHPGINMISFTGSCETGKRILALASQTVKPVTLELGGKNPWIVLEDADIDAAVKSAMPSCFGNTGMACAATGRYYLHEKIYDEFAEKFVAEAKKIVVGDPRDEKTMMGPVVSLEHRDRVEGYIKSGIEEGAKLILGGQRPTTPPLDKGYYVMPTVFMNVTQNMKIAREEIFGPVACFLKFSAKDDVVGMANDTDYGLAAGIWSRDIPRAIRMANEIQAGTIWINGDILGMPDYPWGGYKESGYGKELSISGLEEFVHKKAIAFDLGNEK
ncbi:MAG: aldehyde dehydrogenase family protein [Dehalococcoidales bacterium]|nr:aldehyde dehydrogenase family protein [Dehalococcoidales bacterium]